MIKHASSEAIVCMMQSRNVASKWRFHKRKFIPFDTKATSDCCTKLKRQNGKEDNMAILSPSLLAADFSKLGEEIDTVERAGCTYLHLDVMDGHYVPNISFGPPVIAALRKRSEMFFDTHLMITEPERYLEAFRKAGADGITVHWEACRHIHRTIQNIKELGCKAGVSVNPATPVSFLTHILESVDLVLIMSVNPGFGGQSFIPHALKKIEAARQLIDQSGRDIMLEVDGGVHIDNIADIARAGADTFVSGSAIFGHADYRTIISDMRRQLASV